MAATTNTASSPSSRASAFSSSSSSSSTASSASSASPRASVARAGAAQQHKAENLPPPSDAQQAVLDRIATQRSRLRARRAARAQSLALAHQGGGAGGIDESVLLRAAGFAREHPLAVAAMAGIGLLAGPRRLIRWAGVVLPVLMRLRR